MRLNLSGEKLESLIINDFKLPDTIARKRFIRMFSLAKYIKPYPIFNKNKCIKCKLCIERCPVDAIKISKGRVKLKDKKSCIRCFCCLEHCPVHAVGIKHILFLKR